MRPLLLLPARDDVIDAALADLTPHSPVADLRRGRDDVRRLTQDSFDALFERDAVDGLPRVDRELAALRVAALLACPVLLDFYRERALDLGADTALLNGAAAWPAHPGGEGRGAALLRFVDRQTVGRATTEPDPLNELRWLGLSTHDIATLAQLVGFVNFQVRLLMGLQAIASLPPAGAHASVGCSSNDPSRAPHTSLRWQRSPLVDAILHGPCDLSRADRALISHAVAQFNGGRHSAFGRPRTARGRALVELVQALSQHPSEPMAPQLIALHATGLSTMQMLDAIHATAILAWEPRLALSPAEPVAAEHPAPWLPSQARRANYIADSHPGGGARVSAGAGAGAFFAGACNTGCNTR